MATAKAPANDPQHRALCRELIARHMDTAEGHLAMRAMLPEGAHVARSMHRDMGHQALRAAADLHGHLREMHGEPDGDEPGVARTAPAFLKGKSQEPAEKDADEEMEREYTRVAALVGKLPLTVDAVVRQSLGTSAPAEVRSRLAALRDNAAELADLRGQAARDERAAAEKRCDDLIARYSTPGPEYVIVPATRDEMLGLDPATKAQVAPRWAEEQVRDYVSRRIPHGAAAPVVRVADLSAAGPGAAPVPGAAPLVPPPAAPAFTGSSLVRTGGQVGYAGPVNLAQATREAAAEYARRAGGPQGQPQVVRDIHGQEVRRVDAGLPVPSEDQVAATVAAIHGGQLTFGRPDMSQMRDLND